MNMLSHGHLKGKLSQLKLCNLLVLGIFTLFLGRVDVELTSTLLQHVGLKLVHHLRWRLDKN